MFKLTLLLVMLGGAFLGGYYLGQQPDSPDIFGWAGQAYESTVATGQEVCHTIEQIKSAIPSSTPAAAPPSRHEPASPVVASRDRSSSRR